MQRFACVHTQYSPMVTGWTSEMDAEKGRVWLALALTVRLSIGKLYGEQFRDMRLILTLPTRICETPSQRAKPLDALIA